MLIIIAILDTQQHNKKVTGSLIFAFLFYWFLTNFWWVLEWKAYNFVISEGTMVQIIFFKIEAVPFWDCNLDIL